MIELFLGLLLAFKMEEVGEISPKSIFLFIIIYFVCSVLELILRERAISKIINKINEDGAVPKDEALFQLLVGIFNIGGFI